MATPLKILLALKSVDLFNDYLLEHPREIFELDEKSFVSFVHGLFENGFDNNRMVDKKGHTLLHIAAAKGYLEGVRTLISLGADISIYSDASLKATPLHLASAKGHTNVVEYLCTNGAEINAQLSCEASSRAVGSPLYYAAMHGHYTTVRKLLEAGANPDICLFDDVGFSPLLTALQCKFGYSIHKVRTIDLLLKHGADPTRKAISSISHPKYLASSPTDADSYWEMFQLQMIIRQIKISVTELDSLIVACASSGNIYLAEELFDNRDRVVSPCSQIEKDFHHLRH